MLGFILFACNQGELTAFPSTISWGEIDFRENPPEEGFDARNISLTNTGSQTIDIELSGFDNVHLCAMGLDGEPQSLGKLEVDQSYDLQVGVCDYIEEDGERDTEITGTIAIAHSGANTPVEITWSFTPVFIIE